MQKATTTRIQMDPAVNVTGIYGFANKSFPITGRTMDVHSYDPGLMSKWTSADLKIWSQSGGLLRDKWQGCDGRCFLHVPAAGFAFDCSDPVTESIEYANYTQTSLLLSSSRNGSFHKSGMKMSRPLFHINFDVAYSSLSYHESPGFSYITMDIMYTQANNSRTEKG